MMPDRKDKFEWAEDDLTIVYEPEPGEYEVYEYAEEQKTKAEVEYTDAGESPQLCSNCTMFISPDGCTVVSGTINPDGFCKLFEAKD